MLSQFVSDLLNELKDKSSLTLEVEDDRCIKEGTVVEVASRDNLTLMVTRVSVDKFNFITQHGSIWSINLEYNYNCTEEEGRNILNNYFGKDGWKIVGRGATFNRD